MSVRFLGSFSIQPAILCSRPTLQQGISDYQSYSSLFDEQRNDILKLAPDASIVVDEFLYDYREKKDRITFHLPLPFQPDVSTKQTPCVSFSLTKNKEDNFDAWLEKVRNQITSFIQKAQFFMPQGVHSRSISPRISIHSKFIEALGYSLGSKEKEAPIFIQLQGLFSALARTELALDKLPSSVKFELNRVSMKEIECWQLLKKSFPDFPDLVHSGDPQDYNRRRRLAKDILREKLYGFEEFMATYPKAANIDENMIDFGTVQMTMNDRFGHPYTFTLGVIPLNFVYTYDYGQFDPDQSLHKIYAEKFDYDAFVQDCLKRTHQWIQIFKPEGYDTMNQKEV